MALVGGYFIDREQPALSSEQAKVVSQFHDLYFRRWQRGDADTINLSWFGYPLLKCPLDLWIYQELIVRTKPDVIVETGTFAGGSALYLAMLLEQIGHGRVITIDNEPQPNLPPHPLITYTTGSSTDQEVLARVYESVGESRAMVILDSDHKAFHVYDELVAYHPLVKQGDYLVVEDGNVNGHPTFLEYGPGPTEALQQFFAHNQDFEVDRLCERFLMTLNPGGYLRRK